MSTTKAGGGPRFSLPEEDAARLAAHGHAHGAHGHAHGALGSGFVASSQAHAAPRPALARGAGRGKVLFLDCPSGVAGDMTIAALLDLGIPLAVLEEAVSALGLLDVELVVEQGHAGVIGASHFDVLSRGAQPSRNYGEIAAMIEASSLDVGVKALAQRIFLRLGQAEAEVHRQSLDAVEFHEVGSVDSIVDIVGSAALFEYLGARVVASPLPLGRGFVECQHGSLPLPAPATLLCLQGVPTHPSGLEVELVTPTGAAIVASVADEFTQWPAIEVIRVGWGAGTKALADRPNALRAVLGESVRPGTEPSPPATHVLLEATVDDMTGERAAFALERLLEAGALDAWLVPVTMKKGRPGLVLSILARVAQASELAFVVLRETTSIGVRQTLVTRYELSRRVEILTTPYGEVRVKISGDEPRLKVEFEDCARIARSVGLPLGRITAELQALAEREFS